jgi:hypothetical protein
MISIDTIHLSHYPEDILISPEAKIVVKRGNIFTPTGEEYNEFDLLRFTNGTSVHGSETYMNRKDTNGIGINFKPFNGVVYCFIQTSLPKILKKVNYYPLTESETKEAFRVLGEKLKENGIDCNIGKAKLSRLDIFKDINPSFSFFDYQHIFDLIKGFKTMNKHELGGTTFYWKNKQHEICIYDKKVQLKDMGVNTTFFQPIIRFEYKMYKHHKIKTGLNGIETVEDLLNNYDALSKHYQSVMEKYIFRSSIVPKELISTEDFENMIRQFKETEKNWLHKCIYKIGLHNIAGKNLSPALFDQIHNDNQISPHARNCKERKLRDEIVQAKLNTNSTAELYNELKRKVLDAEYSSNPIFKF